MDDEAFNLFSQLVTDKELDVNCKNSHGHTPLQLLFLRNNDSLLRCLTVLLLQRKNIDINIKNKEKWNVLHAVCFSYNGEHLLEIVLLLIQNGIDVNATSFIGLDALLCLCLRPTQSGFVPKFCDTFQALIAAGADVTWKTPGGWNALVVLTSHHLKHLDYFLMARLLIERGADVNAKDEPGRTVLLMVAAEYEGSKLYELIRLLKEHGADTKVRDHNGFNAANFLERRHYLGYCDMLRLYVSRLCV